MFDKIINATDCVSTNVTNIILTNMKNTMSTNFRSAVSITSVDQIVKYKRDCYILHTIIITITPIIIAIIMQNIGQNKNVLTR